MRDSSDKSDNGTALEAAARRLRSGALESELEETDSGKVLPARQAVEARIDQFVDSLEASGSRSAQLKDDMIWTLRQIYDVPTPGAAPRGGPMLEMVVIADGSRPVFFFQNGRLTGGMGNGPFFDAIVANASKLEASARSVGRIESDLRPNPDWADKWYAGSGFMVAPGLIMTNRHVMQWLVNESSDVGPFSLNGRYWINFEAESGSTRRRRFKLDRVVWAGPAVIGSTVDVGRFDVALIRLGAAEVAGDTLPPPLPVSLDSAAQGERVYVTGYPGKPKIEPGPQPGPDTELETVLASLFDKRFAYKRCASGEVDAIPGWQGDGRRWTIKHDVSTLNGNSGSPIITLSRGSAPTVLALHFGGASRIANYGHVLGSLREKLQQEGATII